MSEELERYRKLLAYAEKDSARACEARGRLPMGSSRARVTTANARWRSAAEHRDRLALKVAELEGTL